MKIKELPIEIKDDIIAKIETQGFCYAITEGYIDPRDILEDTSERKDVLNAIEVLQKFEQELNNI